MKIDRLDTHERLKEFHKQDMDVSECCADLMRQRPFGNEPFYMFVHSRTDDDGVTKRLIWQPRLTKPKAQTNSMLFKGYPEKEIIKVIWMIPDRNLWDQYKKGNLTEHKVVVESIYDFENNRNKLEMKEDDDLDDKAIDGIYRQLAQQAKKKKTEALYRHGIVPFPKI